MNATVKNQVEALDLSLGRLEKSMAKGGEARPGGAAPEGRPVTRQEALEALSKSVKAGAVSLETASNAEDFLNGGGSPAVILKSLEAESAMKKSRSYAIDFGTAQKALARALRLKAVTLQEAGRAEELMRSRKASPAEVIGDLTTRVRAVTARNASITPATSGFVASDGKDFARLQARNAAFGSDPLGTVFR